MAVADLSITTERLSAVEFSMPWMNLGISIIYIKPRQAPPSFFSFLEPFSNEVWISTVISLLVVAIMTFVIGRIISTLQQQYFEVAGRVSPYEWFKPNFCIMDPEELETQWNVSNSVFHTVGALMQQGTDFCPVSLSLRFLVPNQNLILKLLFSGFNLSGWYFLLFHTNHDFKLHSKPCLILNNGNPSKANRISRGPSCPNNNQVRCCLLWIHLQLL